MPRIIAIGGANADVKGKAQQPFIHGTSIPGEIVTRAGGVARNIAHNLALLGCDVALIAAIGRDANGELIRKASAEAGVDCSLLRDFEGPSGVYLAIMDERGELVAAINDMRATDDLRPADLELRRDALARADFIIADCNLSSGCLRWIFEFAQAQGKRLLIEPISVPKAQKLLGLAMPLRALAITPNRQQLRALSGEAIDEAAIKVLHRMGFRHVVMHSGAEGAIVSENGTVTRLPALAAGDVADVTGAGDAAVAGLVFGLIHGLDLVSAARLGQGAAALKIMSNDSVASGMSRDRLLALTGTRLPA